MMTTSKVSQGRDGKQDRTVRRLNRTFCELLLRLGENA